MTWGTDGDENQPPEETVAEETPERSGQHFGRVLAVTALVAAIAGAGFVFGHFVVTPASPSSVQRFTFPGSPEGGYSGSGGSTYNPNYPYYQGLSPSTPSSSGAGAKIAKAVDPGLVDITSTHSYQSSSAEGTGIVLTSNGIVLTNNHVIDGASSITVRDVASNATYTAKVLGYDVSADIALLKLNGASGLATVTTGNSSNVATGDSVVGIGNAGGVGATPTYAAGTVSALDQSISASDPFNPSGSEQLSGLIETNANIQPGDSGGPLVNSSGQVIGVDTAGASSNGGYLPSGYGPGQGYAIPINAALAIVKSIENGVATASVHVGKTAFLGVEFDANGAPSTGFGFNVTPTPSSTNGITIVQVISGEPAAKAGLVVGDIITSINGQSITSGTDLERLLLTVHSGESVSVHYVNPSGKAETVDVTLASGPPL